MSRRREILLLMNKPILLLVCISAVDLVGNVGWDQKGRNQGISP